MHIASVANFVYVGIRKCTGAVRPLHCGISVLVQLVLIVVFSAAKFAVSPFSLRFTMLNSVFAARTSISIDYSIAAGV